MKNSNHTLLIDDLYWVQKKITYVQKRSARNILRSPRSGRASRRFLSSYPFSVFCSWKEMDSLDCCGCLEKLSGWVSSSWTSRRPQLWVQGSPHCAHCWARDGERELWWGQACFTSGTFSVACAPPSGGLWLCPHCRGALLSGWSGWALASWNPWPRHLGLLRGWSAALQDLPSCTRRQSWPWEEARVPPSPYFLPSRRALSALLPEDTVLQSSSEATWWGHLPLGPFFLP